MFGAYIAASLTTRTPASSMSSLVTAVTLAGTVFTFSGCFVAVTITVGRVMAGADCARETAGVRTANSTTRRVTDIRQLWANLWPMPTLSNLLAVCLAGAVGTGARYVIGTWTTSDLGRGFRTARSR